MATPSLLAPPATLAEPCQYAFRSLKSLGLVNAAPLFAPLDAFQKPDAATRAFEYSKDGRRFAFATLASVQVIDAASGAPVAEIPARGVVELALSPKGTQVCTWERMVKPEDGSQHLNLRVWDIASGAELTGFSVKNQNEWRLQYSDDEAYALRQVTNEVHVYRPSEFDKGVQDRLKLEGVASFSLSPGPNPCIAAFVAEKKGAPASVKIYSLTSLASPTSQKTFYKADKIQMKWNAIGTSLLFLTTTDVDKTGKSYYGETNMYLMASAGNFDCRVTLDKEGPIHDFAFSPNEKEFAVSFGFMPAKTVLFDHRVNVVHDFGPSPRNFVSFNPQGRLLVIAGFGNLQGTIDVWDRKTLKKVATLEAPNTSHCEWSPDGRFLLCATLSPRLRVDNGVRIFHHSGTLMHVDLIEELYQASWRPAPASRFPFRTTLSPAPSPSPAALSSAPVKTAPKAAGAYRPPGARGTATPTAYKREDEGGLPYIASAAPPLNGAPNGSLPNGSSPGQGARRRVVPGAAPPPEDASANPPTTPDAKAKRKKKPNGQDGGGGAGPSTPTKGGSRPETPATPAPAIVEDEAASAMPLSPEDKKRRALKKKLDAIIGLRDRMERGDKLEQTQLKKIATEGEVRKELAALD